MPGMDMEPERTLPLVLAIGGHDPSGGAGLQADIETIAACGCRALTVVTALTTQTTCALDTLLPQPPEQVLAQVEALLADSPVAAIKIGLLGSAAMAQALAGLLAGLGAVPVVLDPVLATGAGQPVAAPPLYEAINRQLCPHCTIITPNLPEARTLSGATEPADCAGILVDQGCASVLITGTHDAATDPVINRLYGLTGLLQELSWPRLPGRYHGSGCTLASAIAAGLAHGLRVPDAVAAAQAYAWHSLRQALRTGRCQYTPDRFHDRPTP
jgi:hydroxymethylpyrimidine/phosphomethylpyrimidine kinase